MPRLRRQGKTLKGGLDEGEEHFDNYIVEDSESSLGSLISEGVEDEEDLYSSSIMTITSANDQEELVDKDLLDLLGFIKQLPTPTDTEIASKAVSFGEVTRHKTLIFDLDETLI
jgi:hypothetical protein